MRSLRILELNSGRDVNGAMVYTYLLVQQLVEMGHEVTVVCRHGHWLWDKLDGLRIERISSSMERRWSELRRVASIVRERRIDVVHTHMSRAHMFGILLKYLTGVPCVATAHNRHLQLHWRWNDFVIANSEATCQFQMRRNLVPAGKIRTIHCFTDLRRFQTIDRAARVRMRRELGLAAGQPLLGVIGEVVGRKGHIHLFRALPRIAESHPNFKLLVLGRFKRQESETRKLRRLLVEHKLFRRVIWAGRRDNVPDFLAAMDVCVVPSIEEPLGLVAIEAQATGTPVIVTNTGGLTEIVEDNINGLVVPTKNPDAIADGVIRLLGDRQLSMRLVDNGRASVRERFAPELLTRQVADVLQSVVRASTESHRRAA
jgi:glycosyltransferase involved in cell wall biosynthesis